MLAYRPPTPPPVHSDDECDDTDYEDAEDEEDRDMATRHYDSGLFHGDNESQDFEESLQALRMSSISEHDECSALNLSVSLPVPVCMCGELASSHPIGAQGTSVDECCGQSAPNPARSQPGKTFARRIRNFVAQIVGR